jgi:hypothetical protein
MNEIKKLILAYGQTTEMSLKSQRATIENCEHKMMPLGDANNALPKRNYYKTTRDIIFTTVRELQSKIRE